MARERSAIGELDRPGHVRGPAPKLGIDEVGDTHQAEPDRHAGRHHVEQGPGGDAALEREQRHGEDDAEQAAMEGHAALPDGEDVERMRDVARQVVEQHVACAPAQHHADRRPDDEIVEVLGLHRQMAIRPQARGGDETFGVPPGEQDAHDIADAVPVHRQRSDLDDDRIDIGEGQRGKRQEEIFAQQGLPVAVAFRRGHDVP